MRTTVDIDDELLEEAKAAAKREGITLTAYIERALRQCRPSASAADTPEQERWRPLTFKGEADPEFPWTASLGTMLEYVEKVEAINARP